MYRMGVFYHKPPATFGRHSRMQLDFVNPYMVPGFRLDRNHVRVCFLRTNISSITKPGSLDFIKISHTFRPAEIRGVSNENQGELSDADDELCPVDCVREFKTDEEFSSILEKAKETGSLVVVDFFRTSCGSCKYIEQGFSKLCKGSGNQDAGVIFLKHNIDIDSWAWLSFKAGILVIDEYDEQSEVAERLRIRSVPLFHFYKNGVLLEAFATRDKGRIDAAILKYTSPSQDN